MTVHEWELKCSDLHQVIADTTTGICNEVLTRHIDFAFYTLKLFCQDFLFASFLRLNHFQLPIQSYDADLENNRCLANSWGFCVEMEIFRNNNVQLCMNVYINCITFIIKLPLIQLGYVICC